LYAFEVIISFCKSPAVLVNFLFAFDGILVRQRYLLMRWSERQESHRLERNDRLDFLVISNIQVKNADTKQNKHKQKKTQYLQQTSQRENHDTILSAPFPPSMLIAPSTDKQPESRIKTRRKE